jgi:hypothetical protein
MELGGVPAEEHVPDDVDALVDAQLLHPQDNYGAPYSVACPKCNDLWHGFWRGNCPGETGKIDPA